MFLFAMSQTDLNRRVIRTVTHTSPHRIIIQQQRMQESSAPTVPGPVTSSLVQSSNRHSIPLETSSPEPLIPTSQSTASTRKRSSASALGGTQGRSNWRPDEIAKLLRLVRQFKPTGAMQWIQVERAFNRLDEVSGSPPRV